MNISCLACASGHTLPLLPLGLEGIIGHRADVVRLPGMPVGTELRIRDTAHFRVTGRILWPNYCSDTGYAVYLPLLTALTNVSRETILDTDSDALTRQGREAIVSRETILDASRYTLTRQGCALAWITLSDKGVAGEREDRSGPAIEELLRTALPLCHAQGFLLADSAPALRALLTELALGQGYDIICTTGGTGLGPRDVTPQATEAVLDARLPGFEQAMMAASLAKTPHAPLSRAVVGIIGRCLCINLPGSVKAVRENLAAVLPSLAHALDKLHGDTTDCGGV